MKRPFFYGWVIAIAAGLGIGCSVAVLIPATTGLLVGPLGKEFGWSVQQVLTANLFATVATVFVGPFVGAAVDRFGARRIIVGSLLIEALIVLSFRYIDNSLAMFYARYAAFALLASGGTAIAFTGVVTKWFRRHRGLALGIALAGTGVGGVIWSLAANSLFASVGWRDAFVYFASFLALVATPFFFFVLRESPASMGLLPDGDAVVPGQVQTVQVGMSLAEAARSLQFWLFLAVAFLVGFGVYSIMFNLVPIVKKSGDPTNIAGLIQASLWGALVVGRLMTGVLLDHIFAPRLALVFVLFPVVGAALFAGGATGNTAFAAAMLVGLAAGAEVDTFAYMTSRYFGLKHYGRIYGVCFSAFAMGAGLGPAITARIAEGSGGYPAALWTLVGVLLIGAVLLLMFRRFPAWEVEQGPAGRTFRDLAAAGH
jgi:MFS family permease